MTYRPRPRRHRVNAVTPEPASSPKLREEVNTVANKKKKIEVKKNSKYLGTLLG